MKKEIISLVTSFFSVGMPPAATRRGLGSYKYEVYVINNINVIIYQNTQYRDSPIVIMSTTEIIIHTLISSKLVAGCS